MPLVDVPGTATDGLDDQSTNKLDYEFVAIIMIETFVSAWSAPGRPWSAMGWLLVRLAMIEPKTARDLRLLIENNDKYLV